MHQTDEMNRVWVQKLENQGYRGKIVPISRLKDLEKEIRSRHKKNLLDKELYRSYLASFDFACQQQLADARSLIIVSVPQPQIRVHFVTEDKPHPVIIPPTYNYWTDQQAADFLVAYLEPRGYHLKKVRLPEKLLAVCSGLARYGKNNITYVTRMGSFHRLVVFISDVPCTEDSWEKPTVLEICETCRACMKACPTDAIGLDRFLLHAERCLTFHNERGNDFPNWLSPSWHNCLVGCMVCQKVCPANKDVVKWIDAGATFDRKETALVLNGVSDDQLPRETFKKLNKLGMMEYYHVLGRNLKMIIS